LISDFAKKSETLSNVEFVKLRDWVSFSDDSLTQLVELRKIELDVEKYFFTYVDWTTEEVPRAQYVGKGNRGRINSKVRNKLHDAIASMHGLKRIVVFVTLNERLAFDEEVRLIGELRTYHHGGDGFWGSNFSSGGEGSMGSVRPLDVRQAANKPVEQLTLDGELIAVHSSIKEAMLLCQGANVVRCCQGHLKQSKGFMWRYVEPDRAVIRSDSCKANMHESAYKRSVVQRTLTGEFVATFETARIASEATSIGEDNVRRVCYNGCGTAGGFLWSYVD
jgi:hypothetical protein